MKWHMAYARQTTSITLMLCDVNRNNIYSTKFYAIYRHFLSLAHTINGTKCLCIVPNTCSLFRASWKMRRTTNNNRLINRDLCRTRNCRTIEAISLVFLLSFFKMNHFACMRQRYVKKKKEKFLHGENRMEIGNLYSQWSSIAIKIHKIYHLTLDSSFSNTYMIQSLLLMFAFIVSC